MVDKFNNAPKYEELVPKINEIIDNLGGKLIAGTDLEINSVLPNGYTQLKSITATGSQYIDTGIWLTDNFKAEIIGRFTSTSENQCLLGSSITTSNATYKNIVLAKNTTQYFTNSGSPWYQPQQTNSSAVLDTNKHAFVVEITSSNAKISVDSIENTGTYESSSIEENLFLFAHNAISMSTGSSAIEYAQFELESIKLYDNETLIFNGVPAKYGNQAGLYDTVTSTFMPSLGTSDFVAGEEISTQDIINFTNESGYIKSASVSTLTDVTLSNPANGQSLVYNSTSQKWENQTIQSGGVTDVEVNGTSVVSGGVAEIDLSNYQTTIEAGENITVKQPVTIRVPEGYTQLERINSTSGACCIDTGLKGAIKWEIDVMGNSPYPTKRALIATDGNGSAFFGQYSGSSAWGTNGNSTGVSVTDRINLVINFTTTGCNGTINGTSFSYSATGNLSTNWVLFGTSNYGTRLYGYLYSAKATQNGLVVFDGVPAVRDSDHVAGLYDVVSGNFFTSATTTEFSAGSILSTNTVVSADVGNGTLTISRYGTTLATFTANSTSNVTANMTNPAIQPKEIGASSILNSSTTKAVNSLLYCGNDNLVHSYTETNVPISMAYGMFVNSSQLTANSSISYYYRGEKLGWSVPSAMRIFTARHKVWARCTYPDSSGNVYFVSLYDQNGSTNELQGGYTYYYLGCASSTSTIALDVTGSHFLSINTDGKLTHIDGVEIKQPEDSSSRNIGEIVTSTIPLTDAGLHLLDGALISGSGSYSAFVDYIAGLVTDYPDSFDTEANWQSAVTNYGVCGKFVYTQPTYQLIDTASGTTGWFVHSLEVGSQVYATNGTPPITIASVSGNHITITGSQAALFPNGFDRDTANDVEASVRLPKITGIVEGTTDLTALGDLVEAGLPNISGVLGPSRTLHTYSGTSVPISGAFKKTSISGTTVIGSSGSSADVYKYEIDASLSNSIYGNSTTVQPQTIKVLYYIVIATSTKTQIQVDIDEIATDLNGKADVDLSNVPTSKGILTESYVNGTSWYRVYSDGWCEQGGYQLTLSAANTMVKINLLKPYKDGNYTVVATNAGSSATNYYNVKVGSGAINETDGFYLALSSASAAAWWRTSGYIR